MKTKLTQTKLKNCPWCGGDNLKIECEEWKPYIAIVCLNIDCNASGPVDKDQSSAIKKWNKPIRRP